MKTRNIDTQAWRRTFGMGVLAATFALPAAAQDALDFLGLPQRHTVVEWVTLPSFADVLQHAPLIVRGRVVSQKVEHVRHYGYDHDKGRTLTAEEAGDVYGELPFTISTVVVDEVVRAERGAGALGGKAIAEGRTIEIEELGGDMPDGTILEPHDNPPLRGGDESVLFLTQRPGAAGRYVVVGGYQGRFPVRDGQVEALASHPQSFLDFKGFAGAPVSDFVGRVNAELSKVTTTARR